MLDLQVEATYGEFFLSVMRVEATCGELASQKTAGLVCNPQVSSDLRVEATYGELASQTSEDMMDLGAGPASADLGAAPASTLRSSNLYGQLALQTSASTLWVLAKRRRTRDDHTLGLLESRMEAVSGQLSLTPSLLLSSSLRPHTYVCMYVCMYIYIYIYLNISPKYILYIMHIYMYVCLYVCLCVSVCVSVCVCVCLCVCVFLDTVHHADLRYA
jgi:hypothetical protein